MLVTKGQFLNYQNIFYQKLLRTPHSVSLEVVTVHHEHPEEEFSFERFVGDSKRETKLYDNIQALYEKEVPNRTREKYGLSYEVSGVVYLSPKQIEPIFSTYVIPLNTTKIHFNGRVQVIDKIIYLEEMYGSCVGIQIFVKDVIRGG